MTDERRFTEEEVAAIFERATRVDEERSTLPAGSQDDTMRRPGLTLAEIQRIAGEVGISAEAIQRSALSVTSPAEPAEVDQYRFGAPIGVGGSAHLPRRLNDEEWAELVAVIRDRFNAHGKLEETGSLRSWRNGNLRIQLEPDGDGQRVRMKTYRKSSADLMAVGAGLVGIGTTVGLVGLVLGTGDSATPFAVLNTLGIGFLGANWISLRGWAARRREQMHEIGERAVELASRTLPGTSESAPDPKQIGSSDE